MWKPIPYFLEEILWLPWLHSVFLHHLVKKMLAYIKLCVSVCDVVCYGVVLCCVGTYVHSVLLQDIESLAEPGAYRLG